MKALEIINFGANELKKNNIISSRLDSELLLSNILNKKREEILTNLNQEIDAINLEKYKKLINRRLNNEPLAYITKKREFWSRDFFVNKDTLIPRPETELMVENLINIFRGKKITILDIGTGSGCILISLMSELDRAYGLGIDISKKALAIAEKNSFKLKNKKIRFFNKSVDANINQKFDLVVSNPPYIKSIEIKSLSDDIKRYEPRIALDGGNDGLDLIKKVIYKAKYSLKIKGKLAIEIGNGQFIEVSKILIKNKFKIDRTIKDYDDNVRCIISTYLG
tara:strand:+ start:1761 stop:2600 length:840 start_codon:yes stop_codon:yes gene_type:complete